MPSPGFEPQGGEPLVTKSVNAAFIGTDLDLRLRRLGVEQVVLFGLTTDMCVSTTARVAANLGYRTVVVGDASACFDLPGADGRMIPPRRSSRPTWRRCRRSSRRWSTPTRWSRRWRRAGGVNRAQRREVGLAAGVGVVAAGPVAAAAAVAHAHLAGAVDADRGSERVAGLACVRRRSTVRTVPWR